MLERAGKVVLSQIINRTEGKLPVLEVESGREPFRNDLLPLRLRHHDERKHDHREQNREGNREQPPCKTKDIFLDVQAPFPYHP